MGYPFLYLQKQFSKGNVHLIIFPGKVPYHATISKWFCSVVIISFMQEAVVIATILEDACRKCVCGGGRICIR